MYPKVRSPIITWLLTLVTSGIYLFFWVWLVASEINSAENRKIFPIKLWRNTVIILFVFAFIGVVVAIQADNSLLLFAVTACLFGFFLYVQISIGNYIKEKDAQLKTGGNFSNAVSILLLWLVANTGVAYMQSGINRVIRNEQECS